MKPTVLIEDEVYKKITHWVHKSQYEVSGLGMVRVEKDGILRVVSAILLPQKNGSTHTDIEAEDVNKALFALKDSEGDLRWWWHSHVQMGVFWSGTDHDTIKKIGAGGWVAATVFNQKNEVKSCYYGHEGQKTPWGTEPLFLDDLTTKVTLINDPRTTAWDQEYESNVKVNVPTVRTWSSEDYYGGKTRGGGRTADQYDASVAPPLHKPKYMSKKAFKEWNTKHVEFMQGQFEIEKDMKNGLTVVEGGLDDYGFTQDERTLLAQEGWDMDDVDRLLQAEITPTQMLRMAALGVAPSEVEYLLNVSAYTADDIGDLIDQSASFGQNLFESPKIWRAYEQ